MGFFCNENFEALISSLFYLFQAGIHSPISLLSPPLSSFFSVFLSFFTKSFQFLMAGAAVVGLIYVWRRRKTKAVPFVFFEFLIGLLIISIFPLLLFTGLWSDRALQFAYFPLCALAIYGFETLSHLIGKRIQFTKNLRTLGLCLIIVILPLLLFTIINLIHTKMF